MSTKANVSSAASKITRESMRDCKLGMSLFDHFFLMLVYSFAADILLFN